jgi:hypothetical protein
MTKSDEQSLDIAGLARCADLALDTRRQQAVRPILEAWLPAAIALSRKMSQPQWQNTLPATIFSFPLDPLDNQ